MISNDQLDNFIYNFKQFIENGINPRLHEQAMQTFLEIANELKERRETEFKPATRFVYNTSVMHQIAHIVEETKEVIDAYLDCKEINDIDDLDDLIEEINDVKYSCDTLYAILGLNEEQIRKSRLKVIEKNRVRGYYNEK